MQPNQQKQPPINNRKVNGSNPNRKDKQDIKQPKGNSNSTQNLLDIAEIRDGLVIMSDGSYRAVVFTKSINFDLMSQQEREAVEYGFQAFINSLYFPIQIFIRSKKIDMKKYLDKLEVKKNEHENMLLAILMEDYISFINSLTQQVNIMDKKFYIVIQYSAGVDLKSAAKKTGGIFSGVVNIFKGSGQSGKIKINEHDLNQAKIEMRNRVQAVLGALNQVGVQGAPLNTQELIELYYDVYNPDTATRQHISVNSGVGSTVITKGQGQAPRPDMTRSY